MKKIRIVIPEDPETGKQIENMLWIENEYGQTIELHEVGELKTVRFSTAKHGTVEMLVLEMEVREP